MFPAEYSLPKRVTVLFDKTANWNPTFPVKLFLAPAEGFCIKELMPMLCDVLMQTLDEFCGLQFPVRVNVPALNDGE